MIADLLTVSRMVLSASMLFFAPDSVPFVTMYLLCGLSDAADGFAARKLHTESEKGAMLDSAADLIFAAVYAVRILPHLSVPLWVWIWTAGIAIVKTTGILLASRRTHRLTVRHSFLNKLTGLLLFLLPLTVRWMQYGAALVCAAASAAAVEEIVRQE